MLCWMGSGETLPGHSVMQTFLALMFGVVVACVVYVLGRILTGAGGVRDQSLSKSAGADIMDEVRRHSAAS